VNSKQIIKQLQADGWYLVRVKGSHHQFKHPVKPGLVTVKHPDGEIPLPTLYSIERQAGWRGQPAPKTPAQTGASPTTMTEKSKAS
jgi:predicted RNA binding protein YcfA (HicA-like mRNA interferase family)